jgi:hypothetical protein
LRKHSKPWEKRTMNNDPSILLIGSLIVLQDTAARASGAGTYLRAAIAGLVIAALLYARHSAK